MDVARGVPAWRTGGRCGWFRGRRGHGWLRLQRKKGMLLVQRKKGTRGSGTVGSEVGYGGDLRKKAGHGSVWFKGGFCVCNFCFS